MGTLSREDFVRMAREHGATVVDSPAATVIVLAAPTSTADELVALERAADLAATSGRVIRDAIRAGELPAFGRQRDRSVKRSDLDAWIAARRVRVDVGRDDDAIDARVRRLERQRGKAAR